MNYQLNEAKMFADVSNGLAIVINSETGIYYGMNPFTSDLFDNLIKGSSVEDICAAALRIGAPSEFPDRFTEFIKGLLDKEIIVEGIEATVSTELEKSFAEECAFEISWDEFADAQELLLADPIHEVKEDTGWSPDSVSLNPDAEDVERRKSKI